MSWQEESEIDIWFNQFENKQNVSPYRRVKTGTVHLLMSTNF